MSDENSDPPSDDETPAPIALSADAPSAVNPETQRRRRRRKQSVEEQIAEFWQRTLDDPIGRVAIWGVLASARIWEERFAVGPNGFPQPEATWFYAGEKSFARRLLDTLLKTARPGALKMLDEHHPDFVRPATRARS